MSLKDLYIHLKADHLHFGRYAYYICAQGQCNRKCTDRYTFGRHMESQHCDCLCDAPLLCEVNENYSDTDTRQTASNSNETDCASMDIECAVDSASVQTDINSFSLKHMAAKYVAEAKRKTSSLTTAQFMIQACSNTLEFIVTDIMSDMVFKLCL